MLRWLLCQLLPAWLCLGIGWASSAAASVGIVSAGIVSAGMAAQDEAAPMCDPHGASVVALTEVPEVDRGKLEELPCDALLRWLGSGIDLSVLDVSAVAHDGAPPPAPELQVDRSRPDGVIPLTMPFPTREATLTLPQFQLTGLLARPGHRLPIFRPPAPSR